MNNFNGLVDALVCNSTTTNIAIRHFVAVVGALQGQEQLGRVFPNQVIEEVY